MVLVRRKGPRPTLVAHRGDPRHAPENTLFSLREAVARGARAVEMDLRRRPDGRWVLFHDPLRGRVLPGWVPGLPQALAYCRRAGVRVYLDVKERSGERSLAQHVRRSGAWGRTVWMGGTPATLRRMRAVAPDRPLFWVTGYRRRITGRVLATARSIPLTGIAGYKGWVSRRIVERTHRAGLRIFVWTARTVPELRRFARMGVDGIMSEVWPPPSI